MFIKPLLYVLYKRKYIPCCSEQNCLLKGGQKITESLLGKVNTYKGISTLWKRPWCWKKLRAIGEVGDRGWDGWMASLTHWTWVWANSGRQWRTEKPGVLQFMGSQRVRHNLATEQQQQAGIISAHNSGSSKIRGEHRG